MIPSPILRPTSAYSESECMWAVALFCAFGISCATSVEDYIEEALVGTQIRQRHVRKNGDGRSGGYNYAANTISYVADYCVVLTSAPNLLGSQSMISFNISEDSESETDYLQFGIK